MNDEIIKIFIEEFSNGKSSPLPSEYNMELVVARAKVICPNTPDHIFDALLA